MIDLHVHSTASDGTCPPEELAERGRAFSLMALTDHDNTDGCARFLSACRALHLVYDEDHLACLVLIDRKAPEVFSHV